MFESAGQLRGSVSSGSRNKRVFAIQEDEIMVPDFGFWRWKWGDVIETGRFLLNRSRDVLHSDDPISYIMQCNLSDTGMDVPCVCIEILCWCCRK